MPDHTPAPHILIACYTQDGEHHGYYTNRNTITQAAGKADLWFVSEQGALDEIERLGLEHTVGWKDYLWCPETVQTQDLAVSSSEAPETRPHGVINTPTERPSTRPERIKRTRPAVDKPVDTTVSSASVPDAVATVVKPAKVDKPAVVKPATAAAVEAPTATEDEPIVISDPMLPTAPPTDESKEEPMSVATKIKKLAEKGRAKIAAKARASARTKPATKKSPPRKRRTVVDRRKARAAAAVARKSAKKFATKRRQAQKRAAVSRLARIDTLPCLCGCGKKARGYFIRGHIARFTGQLGRIAEGSAKPSTYFDLKTVRALGPWTKTRQGGLRPRTANYKILRPTA